MFFDHGFLDFFERILRAQGIAGLNQPTADGSRHLHLAGWKTPQLYRKKPLWTSSSGSDAKKRKRP
jgi:hypothetical protein